MSTVENAAQTCTAAVQTAVAVSRCQVCDADLRGGQTVACSDKCRAVRWRRRQERARRGTALREAAALLLAEAERIERQP